MSAYFSDQELKKLLELIQKTQGLLTEGHPALEPIKEALELLQDAESGTVEVWKEFRVIESVEEKGEPHKSE